MLLIMTTTKKKKKTRKMHPISIAKHILLIHTMALERWADDYELMGVSPIGGILNELE